MIGILLIVLVAGMLFLLFWPSFGGRISRKDQIDYRKRAANYRHGRFRNEADIKLMKRVKRKEKNQFVSREPIVPKEMLPVGTPKLEGVPKKEKLTVTWFGHSTFLVQMEGKNILIDPVFSNCTSPVSFLGPKRFSTLPMKAKDLPHIDLVLITHDHYDHLDETTIREIEEKVTAYYVPLGVEKDLRRWGVKEEKVTNFAWWEEKSEFGLTITCTPAQHFSGRRGIDQNKTLWCSWVIKSDSHQIFASGDGGYGTQFKEIKKRLGSFELALIEAGQYDVAWAEIHMKPEQSYQAGIDLEADVIIPIHWAAFRLANHPWNDSPVRVVSAAGDRQEKVFTPRIGETITIGQFEQGEDRWWR
ncbi:outer membrane protein romA [Lachnospiraceae bacterium KM106-2]|nr:outer membrane protein romA [Lachnospiraceae bacterium KM106-2]